MKTIPDLAKTDKNPIEPTRENIDLFVKASYLSVLGINVGNLSNGGVNVGNFSNIGY